MPERAILYQRGVRQGLNEDIASPKNLVELLTNFFAFREPDHEEWDAAVAEFKLRIPELAERAKQLIDAEHKSNRAFRDSFEAFYRLCQQAINPNLTRDAVEKMLIQHLLTERIFRRVFHAEEFRSRNVIAAEIEKVIASMTSRQFSRDQFLSDLDRFYKAIERAAEDKDDYSEKQAFLNTVYERFFQGYSPKEADTHGIVYTPQPIVDFMVRSVEDILKKEFGRSLADHNVHILDPFVGTGNFITRVMRQIAETDKGALPYKYEHELHCNEVMLLPYYIASMNIEHEYLDQTREYKEFPGICLVDTFDMRPQSTMFAEKNLQRIERQRQQPIYVVIGNPPYNAWQVNENDNNRNRRYLKDGGVDTRVAETYAKASRATNKSALSDPYVKAIRWSSDRISNDGVVAFVTNSGFIDALAADGMRKHLLAEFDEIYLLDLGGNVRRNPKLSGTTHNVFGIQVGVSINLLIRRDIQRHKRSCKVFYSRTEEFWKKEQKYAFLDNAGDITKIHWTQLQPDETGAWLRTGHNEFRAFVPLNESGESIFDVISNGVQTNRDAWVYNFSRDSLESNVNRFGESYNAQVEGVQGAIASGRRAKLDYDDKKIKWSSRLIENAERGTFFSFDERRIRPALYRPFSLPFLYFDPVVVHRCGQFGQILPTADTENKLIWLKLGGDWPTFALAANTLVDQLPQGGSQCFPFYTYSEDGANRRENITDWALEQFRSHYHDPSISKWDIFHYIYAVLHHPEYRSRYAANLKRELPRIPFLACSSSVSSVANVFRSFVAAGKRLADLHVHYEQQPEYPLDKLWNPTAKLDYRVTKMRLSKDKSILFYNDALTLKGIPLATYEYRLGNRSALEWVIDQYQVSTDKRSGITNDPNRPDDREYILRLIGQVITVSLETVQIVKSLPEFVIADSTAATGA